jgi:hypothetical protein
MDAKSIDRIVAATGEAPNNLDRAELLSELEGIRSLYRTGLDVRKEPAKRSQQVVRIVETAEHLIALIRDEPWLGSHQAALRRLIADAESGLCQARKAPERVPRTAPETRTTRQAQLATRRLAGLVGLGQLSATENLTVLLARAYERHYGKQLSWIRDPGANTVEGQVIDFIDAAIKELGITLEYSRSSVARALSKWRHG